MYSWFYKSTYMITKLTLTVDDEVIRTAKVFFGY